MAADLMLIGKFKYESAENVDEYLCGLGVGLVLRKVQSVARPVIEISFSQETNEWTVVSESVFKTKQIVFAPMQKFKDRTFDSRKCKTVAEIADNGKRMTWEQICAEGPDVKTIITVTETGLNLVMQSGQYSCQQTYSRQV
ncbi:unnamed protein product [Orchesella dallaii]|uniref:Uncharacterized protein n=1 Tax=Orchesella dallaii TaxID=48710 RepID=A0ABP1QHB4_9HEXA